MRRRYADIDQALLIRAGRLARLPGVNRDEACRRFGLSIGMLRRAMKDFRLQIIPSANDIVLHALTDAGNKRSGELPDLDRVASYRDYVNKDGATVADVQDSIDQLVTEGMLSVKGDHWKLLKDFP